jgi:hypothetical protein
MNFYIKSKKLLVGYFLGILCFFFLDLCWGDPALAALIGIALWLPMNVAYGALILLISGRTEKLNLPLLLEINGFLIGMCPVLEVWPPYLTRPDVASFLILEHAVIFLMVNVVIISLSRVIRKKGTDTIGDSK